jgi:hypothetical protein
VIAQIAEEPTELTSDLRSIDRGERRIAVRISRNRESGWDRIGRAPPGGPLSDSQRQGERGEELTSSEHERLATMIALTAKIQATARSSVADTKQPRTCPDQHGTVHMRRCRDDLVVQVVYAQHAKLESSGTNSTSAQASA